MSVKHEPLQIQRFTNSKGIFCAKCVALFFGSLIYERGSLCFNVVRGGLCIDFMHLLSFRNGNGCFFFQVLNFIKHRSKLVLFNIINRLNTN